MEPWWLRPGVIPEPSTDISGTPEMLSDSQGRMGWTSVLGLGAAGDAGLVLNP
jgi:hypothetical protein